MQKQIKNYLLSLYSIRPKMSIKKYRKTLFSIIALLPRNGYLFRKKRADKSTFGQKPLRTLPEGALFF